MDHATEVDILRELLDLQARGTPFLDDSWVTTDVQRYRCAEVFARERAGIACALPQIAAHSSQLPGSGAFLGATAETGAACPASAGGTATLRAREGSRGA